ncbi:hypothetical protein KJ644_00700 [Candidatus Dependentiae bacterium]|nr:hypothetical protein [Candidatus Dependentiae bacterium]MBU4386973.1 hypothetical protein [Candidatus Dependentiae bacterium]MCG2755959.1 hypothetical protein [Candidatus Dependentiae bacterium]
MNICMKLLGLSALFLFFLNAQEADVIEQQFENANLQDVNTPEVNENIVEPVEKLEEPQKETKINGIDNVNFSEEKIGTQGNWLKKREWLKSSYAVNDEIQNIVSEIQSMPGQYNEQFNKIDKELDEFYKKEGFNQASSAALFAGIKKYLSNRKKYYKEQIKSGVTTEGEIEIDDLLKITKDLKTKSEQLRLDIKSIYDLDRSIKDRLKKLDDLEKMALEESAKSAQMVEEIWNIIDDKKARTIYYQLKGDSLEKVNAIKKYVTQTLWQDFNNFIELIKTQMNIVSESIAALEKDGLIVKDRTERLKDIKKIQEDEAKRLAEFAALKKLEQNRSWYQKFYSYIVDIFAKIYNFLSN